MSGEIVRAALVVALSYLVGAIPWSWLAGRCIGGLDLRRVGSGNLGASNTFRALGARVALPVLILDVAKGVVAPLVFARLGADGPAAATPLLATLCGVAAILGHMFPVYLGFRPEYGFALFEIGRIYRYMGVFKTATEYFERALRVKREFRDVGDENVKREMRFADANDAESI